MRHGKSDWHQPGLADHDRPLNPRGQRAVPLMAQLLLEQGVRTDIILASSAVRVQQTLELLQASWAMGTQVITERSLYLASADTITSIIHALHDSWKSAMLVGHNPGLCEFCWRLSREELDMPTAAVAVFCCHDANTWHDSLNSHPWQLQAYWKPRDLES